MHLKELRARRKLTQWDLRNQTGVHQSKLSLIEKGYISPTEREKEKIAGALSVNVDEIDWQVYD
jgi:transcriptional regulator with XRE-family HTH domain